MDTSESYIKMCEKAEEIQAQWLNHDTEGDFAVSTKTIEGYNGFWELKANEVMIVGNDSEYDLTIEQQADIDETGAIWLPRQDQLQEMVGVNWVRTLNDFGWWVNDNSADEWSFDNVLFWGSMEQLWLAFVMKEKYNKVWNGTDWVKS